MSFIYNFIGSPLPSAVTVGGYGNGTAGNALNALNYPWGLAVDENDTLYVADNGNYRVMKLQEGLLNGSIVAGANSWGSSVTLLRNPTGLAIDTDSNIYVDDNNNHRIMLWRKNSSSGILVAGNGSFGNSTTAIDQSTGLAVDSQGNIYVSEYSNQRVMKWTPNATFGILVAGMTDVAGNSNQLLNTPYGLYLDEINSYLYIADLSNHRIQRYHLGTTTNGTTVAGGYGQGSGSQQFNEPHGICVSKKTGDIYIADRRNHRIQRWSQGATSGVTILGVTGVSGINATLLNGPINVVLSMNETLLYVSDTDNNRVQRHKLT
jgi:sugar lactone lactonase YvrE